MALHHSTVKSAVKKYGPLHATGKSAEDVKFEIGQDDAEFDPDGIDEIYAAILSDDSSGKKAGEYIVAQEFRDISDFNKTHEVGADVSNFDKKRLEQLVQLKLVKKK